MRPPRLLTARYAGTCAVCDEPTEVGASIWHIGRGVVSHELCGSEVDTSHLPTHRERMEARAERREGWAEARAARAETASARAHGLAEMIPFGQPILVGHHSESRHRRDLGRMDSAMRDSVESSKMARRHAGAADEIRAQLRTSIYDDDPDAIEQLRAKLEGLEAERAAINAYNKAHRAGKVTPELVAAVPRKFREWYAEKGERIASYATQNLGGNITRTRQRLARLEAAAARRTV